MFKPPTSFELHQLSKGPGLHMVITLECATHSDEPSGVRKYLLDSMPSAQWPAGEAENPLRSTNPTIPSPEKIEKTHPFNETHGFLVVGN